MAVTPPPVVPIPDPDRIPQRDGSQPQGQYSNNADYWSLALNDSLEGVVDALEWTEDTANLTEGWANAASTSATTATTQAGIATTAASSAINSPGTNATSTTSITPVIGANAFTLAQTGKTFVVGQFVTVADATTPTTKFFNGAITAFNSGTGAITVTANVVVGTSSGSNWVITAAAPAQGERFVAPVQTYVALGNVTGTVNIDLRVALSYSMTLTGNTTLTFTMPDLFASGVETEVALLITKGGSYSLVMPVGTEYSDGAAPNPLSGSKNEYIGTRRVGSNWIFALGRKNIA